jgi:hypothetical protein
MVTQGSHDRAPLPRLRKFDHDAFILRATTPGEEET